MGCTCGEGTACLLRHGTPGANGTVFLPPSPTYHREQVWRPSPVSDPAGQVAQLSLRHRSGKNGQRQTHGLMLANLNA